MAVSGRRHPLGNPLQPVRSVPNPRIIQTRPAEKSDSLSDLIVSKRVPGSDSRRRYRTQCAPIGPIPRPCIIRLFTPRKLAAEENHLLSLRVIRHALANRPGGRACGRAPAQPVRAGPDPRIIEIVAGIVTAEKYDLLSGLVVCHPMQKSCGRRVRCKSLGPVIAIPKPRIEQPTGCVLRAAKQHNLLPSLVVGHVGKSDGRWSINWVLERPQAVPDPSLVGGRKAIRTSENDNLPACRIPCRTVAGTGRRRGLTNG